MRFWLNYFDINKSTQLKYFFTGLEPFSSSYGKLGKEIWLKFSILIKSILTCDMRDFFNNYSSLSNIKSFHSNQEKSKPNMHSKRRVSSTVNLDTHNDFSQWAFDLTFMSDWYHFSQQVSWEARRVSFVSIKQYILDIRGQCHLLTGSSLSWLRQEIETMKR